MVLSDRIAVMNQGAVQQFAAPMEVYARPANRFVAGFIGSPQMNFLPAQICGGREVHVVGVRPHDLKPQPELAGDFTLKGELLLVEPAGPFQFLDVAVGDHIVRATCVDPAGLAPGDTVTLGAAREALRFFATDGGQCVNHQS